MLDRLTRFNLISRVACLWVSALTVHLGWASPLSLTGQVFAAGPALGSAALAVMTLAVIGGFVDVLVSDLLPERYTGHWLARRRHLGYMLLAATYFVQAIPAASIGTAGFMALTMHYVGMGTICAWLSWSLVIRSEQAGRPYASS